MRNYSYLLVISVFIGLSLQPIALSAHAACQSSTRKKLHAAELEELGFMYARSVVFMTDREMYTLPEEKLIPQDLALTQRYKEQIAQGYEIEWSVEYLDATLGYGAFAQQDIEPGQMVGEYTGIIVGNEMMVLLVDTDFMWNFESFERYSGGKKLYVDAKKVCNFTRFINHSYKPNVDSISVYANNAWHILYIANKPIKKGEQLLVNYGEGYWRGRYEPVDL